MAYITADGSVGSNNLKRSYPVASGASLTSSSESY